MVTVTSITYSLIPTQSSAALPLGEVHNAGSARWLPVANTKSEYRNPKQARSSNDRNEDAKPGGVTMTAPFLSLAFLISNLLRISIFGLRISVSPMTPSTRRFSGGDTLYAALYNWVNLQVFCEENAIQMTF
jgi:hypothetical protein